MKEEITNKMLEKAKIVYENEQSAHDFEHIKRVLNYCKVIWEKEDGNWDEIFVSALFHDIHRVIQSQTGRFVPANKAMRQVKNVLKEFKNELPKDTYKRILFNIKNHDNKDGDPKKMSKELIILQDADMLDSLGEVGLERTKKYCIKHNIPFYSPIPLDDKSYLPDVNPISTTHYVYRTMLPHYDKLRTMTAREISIKDKTPLLDFISNQKTNKR